MQAVGTEKKQMLENIRKLAKIAQNFVSSKLSKVWNKKLNRCWMSIWGRTFHPYPISQGSTQCGNCRNFLLLRFYFSRVKYVARRNVKIAILWDSKLISRKIWVAGKFLRFYTVGSKSSFGTCLKLITLKIVL